jgi:tetratricopeptide (TPR) repeat protein
MEAGFKAARRGYWQEALVRFEAANATEPNQPRILNNLAVALEAVGRYDEARETYEKALDLARGDRNLTRNFKFFEEFYQSFVLREDTEEMSGKRPAPAQEEDDDQ